jgi:DNA-binding CsgD family transcriptional regulator
MADLFKYSAEKSNGVWGNPFKTPDYASPNAKVNLAQTGGEDTSLDKMFAQWLDADQSPRFIVDRTGKVVWLGNSIKAMSSTSVVSITRNGPVSDPIWPKMQIGKTVPQELFLPILNASTLAEKANGEVVSFRPTGDDHPYILQIIALGDEANRTFGVNVLSYKGITDQRKCDLKRLWDLSSAEVKIVDFIFRGVAAQDIAEELGVSVDTVRTHIRHIYAKTGVKSREALFSELGPILF